MTEPRERALSQAGVMRHTACACCMLTMTGASVSSMRREIVDMETTEKRARRLRRASEVMCMRRSARRSLVGQYQRTLPKVSTSRHGEACFHIEK